MPDEQCATYSDPVKLLTLFGVQEVAGDEGIEEDLVPYYVLILNELGNAGFQYAFDYQPALVSHRLNRDLGRLIDAEYISKNSPLLITHDGKHFLERYGRGVGEIEDHYAEVLANYVGKEVGELLALAYTLKTQSL